MRRFGQNYGPTYIWEFKKQRRRGLRKRHLKRETHCFKLYRAYSVSFNKLILSNVGNFFWSWLSSKGLHRISGKEKKVVVLFSRPPQNMNLGSFTSYSSSHWKEINVPKSVLHVQSCCLANPNLLPFLPLSLPSPSSLLKLPILRLLCRPDGQSNISLLHFLRSSLQRPPP